MKKIVSIVLNNFVNDSRVLKEARTLVKAGNSVVVVALHEEGLPEKEIIEGIEVHRIKLLTKKWSNHPTIQTIKYIELLYRMIKEYRNVDIIHCNDLGPLPIASLIQRISSRRIKIVYDAHEYETERNGLKGFKKKTVKFLERKLIKKVNSIITVSDSIAYEYSRLYNIEKPELVLNCPYYQHVEKNDKFRKRFGISKETKIYLYQGALTTGRGLELIIKAFENIESDSALVVMGYGPLKKMVLKHVNENNSIYYHEAVDPQVLLSYTSSADVGICLIEKVCLSYEYSLPNKFFEYSMAGLPTITNNLIEVKSITNKYKNGWILAEDTVEELSGLINKIKSKEIKAKSKNAHEVAQLYNWENQERILLNVYEELYK